jgi:membrane-associated protease RseP (regulator of RpoE activity)
MIDYLPQADPQSFAEVLALLQRFPAAYAGVVREAVSSILSNPVYLKHGLSFSLSLMFILISHEMGHYIACRLYRVQATLPFFIPTPPMIGPAGTFGAFIKIQSPMPSRRAVFDIGVAGPIAGFIALIPVAIIALATMHQVGTQEITVLPPGAIYFTDPLFFKLLAGIGGINLKVAMDYNGFYSAAWVGLLITALNLIPSGQLDGGHAIYAIFGKRVHWWTGRIAFVAMIVFSGIGWFVYGSPSGFLFAILLGIMMHIRHPEPLDETPLDAKRRVIAALTLLIFILCFLPIPLQIGKG